MRNISAFLESNTDVNNRKRNLIQDNGHLTVESCESWRPHNERTRTSTRQHPVLGISHYKPPSVSVVTAPPPVGLASPLLSSPLRGSAAQMRPGDRGRRKEVLMDRGALLGPSGIYIKVALRQSHAPPHSPSPAPVLLSFSSARPGQGDPPRPLG